MITKHLTLVLLIVIALLSSTLLYMVLDDQRTNASRERDIVRVSEIGLIRDALDEYQERYGYYPPCLYKTEGCTSLEGSVWLLVAPVDPLTNIRYSYAAIGRGSACTSYHLGASLERTRSQSLLTGSDAPPVKSTDLCRGSSPDFSGLSHAQGGQPCNTTPGIAQPTDVAIGETCYDLRP